MRDSQSILREYVITGSEDAFRELVARYVNLVFSTALRLVDGDSQKAEDIAQTVFIHLARKAHTLSAQVMLGGWLHRNTCNVAATLMRSDRRRQIRERSAMEMNALTSEPNNSQSIWPVLDEAIGALRPEDRTILLLRFFEQQDLRAVGHAVGISEDAARMRISRALEKLQEVLKRKGITIAAAALGTTLTAEAVTVAPAGIVSVITGAALASGALGSAKAAIALKLITLSKAKLALMGALAIAGVAVPLAYQQQMIKTLRDDISRHNLSQLNHITEPLSQPAPALTDQVASSELASNQLRDLLRLRSEVGTLRRENRELQTRELEGTAELQKLRDEKQALAEASRQFHAETPGATNSSPSPLYIRRFRIEPEGFQRMRTELGGESNELSSQALIRYLARNQVNLPPPQSLYLNDTEGTLTVRTSLDQLDKIEILIGQLRGNTQ
jgi:RNA polymerase sigma factor (sigma-70 family)